MEYNAVEHRAARARSRASTRCRTLGPYDYWAIEYALPRARARAGEARSSRRSPRARSEPQLAFATDEDAELRRGSIPQVNQRDLGADPLAYARARIALVARAVAAHRDAHAEARRELLAAAPQLHARPVRGRAGRASTPRSTSAASRRCAIARAAAATPLKPVAGDKQRAALDLLATEVFSADSFHFSPAFLRRMSVSAIRHRRRARARPHRADASTSPSTRRCSTCSARCWRRCSARDRPQRLLNNELKVDDPTAGADAGRAVRDAASARSGASLPPARTSR